MNDEATDREDVIREGELASKRIDSWQRNMNRAFKGIVPRPQRNRLLREALARHEGDA